MQRANNFRQVLCDHTKESGDSIFKKKRGIGHVCGKLYSFAPWCGLSFKGQVTE